MTTEECCEQIQEDILAYFDSVAFVHSDHGRDDLKAISNCSRQLQEIG